MDAPLPGTDVFDRLRADPRVWHFAFHGARDVAEMLVAGRERPYLQAFFDARISTLARSPTRPRRVRFALRRTGCDARRVELYRAFDQDAADTRGALARDGKLSMPVLAVGGAISTSGSLVEAMMREVADDVTGLRIPRTAHWIAEENPQALADGLIGFLAPGRFR